MASNRDSAELRQAMRLARQSDHSWQLHLEDDRLITKNITNLSATGMAFKAPGSSDIREGQTLKFNLSIEPGVSFECEGRVLWARGASPGSMRQIGIQFSKLPIPLDSAIVRQINEYALRTRKDRITKGRRPLTQKIVMVAPPPVRTLIVRIVGATLIMALTSAFLTALLMHKLAHPEQSIAHTFNHSLIRKLSSAP